MRYLLALLLLAGCNPKFKKGDYLCPKGYDKPSYQVWDHSSWNGKYDLLHLNGFFYIKGRTDQMEKDYEICND
jgi:hypothetical protein